VPHTSKPIRDTATGKEYPSMASAARDLAIEFGEDPFDDHAWYAIREAAPDDRFLTPNPSGVWVRLDDPSLPPPPPAWGA
jgi:hypothetical protein